MEIWILIAWIYNAEGDRGNNGTAIAATATAITQEFFSETACGSAGSKLKRIKIPRGMRVGNADVPAAWDYICVPKGGPSAEGGAP